MTWYNNRGAQWGILKHGCECAPYTFTEGDSQRLGLPLGYQLWLRGTMALVRHKTFSEHAKCMIYAGALASTLQHHFQQSEIPPLHRYADTAFF